MKHLKLVALEHLVVVSYMTRSGSGSFEEWEGVGDEVYSRYLPCSCSGDFRDLLLSILGSCWSARLAVHLSWLEGILDSSSSVSCCPGKWWTFFLFQYSKDLYQHLRWQSVFPKIMDHAEDELNSSFRFPYPWDLTKQASSDLSWSSTAPTLLRNKFHLGICLHIKCFPWAAMVFGVNRRPGWIITP